ncbi:hypothetical protein CSHISOI_01337 [Colletotrichum shisoi]|uniref:Uncharacterized protein n=1 Tax=Colletotrichum shisoi TaxID=2078593 RepID=A0A5Q4C417_9PEZI|nr:hypothetical protein CSHISOI_01337 [Colletotrichum shisoi]
MTKLRIQLSNRMKEVCMARVERVRAQSLRYAGAAHFVHGIHQTNSTDVHSTDPNSTSPNDEHGIRTHGDVSNGTSQAIKGSGTDGTHLDDTHPVGVNSHIQYANYCTGAHCKGGCASSSSSNGMHHNEPSLCTPDVDEAYGNSASEATIASATHSSRISPFTNSNNESGDGAQENFLRGPVVDALYRSRTGSSQHTAAWRPAALGLATAPPPPRHLHDNWRHRDDTTPTASRTAVLAVPAEEEGQPEQPSLLESLDPSVPDPEPWQGVLYQKKGWSLGILGDAAVASRTVPGPPSGLVLMLRSMHGDSWPRGDDEDEGSEGVLTPATLGDNDSFAQFQRELPARPKKRKTLLEIYNEAKKEAALREQGQGHTLQFGDMTALELSA